MVATWSKNIGIIGDSLTLMGGNEWLMLALNSMGYHEQNIYYKGVSGKKINDVDEESKTTVQNIVEARTQLGDVDHWIIALGTNNASDSDAKILSDVAAVLNAVQSGERVTWVGLGFQNPSHPDVARVNSLIQAAVPDFADWNAIIHDGRDETGLWNPDGVHLYAPGYILRSNYYATLLEDRFNSTRIFYNGMNGTPGTAVTQENLGSLGDPTTTVEILSPTTAVYSSDHPTKGSSGIRIAQSGTAEAAFVEVLPVEQAYFCLEFGYRFTTTADRNTHPTLVQLRSAAASGQFIYLAQYSMYGGHYLGLGEYTNWTSQWTEDSLKPNTDYLIRIEYWTSDRAVLRVYEKGKEVFLTSATLRVDGVGEAPNLPHTVKSVQHGVLQATAFEPFYVDEWKMTAGGLEYRPDLPSPVPQVGGATSGGTVNSGEIVNLAVPPNAQTGDWLVVAAGFIDNSNIASLNTTAREFETILPKVVRGTSALTILRRKLQAGDSNFDLGTIQNSGDWGGAGGLIRLLAFWVRGAGDDDWVIGSPSTSRPTTTTSRAPSINTVDSDSLVLAVGMERTLAATTLGPYPSGWEFLGFSGEVGDSTTTTIVATRSLPHPGSTGNADFVYGSTQATNGTGVQIAIPPSSSDTPPSGLVTLAYVSDFDQQSLRLGAVSSRGDSARVLCSTSPDLSTPSYGLATISSQGWITGKVSGLQPGTQYFLGVEIDGVLQTDVLAQGRTLREAGTPASFTVLAGSCQTTGSNHLVLERMASENADFLAHMGDLHYADATTEAAWRAGFISSMTAPRMKSLVAKTPMNYIWDNHDRVIVDTLNMGQTNPVTVSAYRELMGSDRPATNAQYRTWVAGRIRFIQTDAWSLRDDPDLVAEPRQMFGATQVAWLKQTLETSTEELIVWFCSFPNHYLANGRWNSFQSETNDLGAWIAQHASVKERLVMIGGDSHDVRADSGTRQYEVNGTTLHNFPGVPSLNASGFSQGGGVWVTANWDIAEQATPAGTGVYSRLTFEDDGFALVFRWEAVNQDGEVLASWERLSSSIIVDGVPASLSYWNVEQERLIPMSLKIIDNREGFGAGPFGETPFGGM